MNFNSCYLNLENAMIQLRRIKNAGNWSWDDTMWNTLPVNTAKINDIYHCMMVCLPFIKAESAADFRLLSWYEAVLITFATLNTNAPHGIIMLNIILPILDPAVKDNTIANLKANKLGFMGKLLSIFIKTGQVNIGGSVMENEIKKNYTVDVWDFLDKLGWTDVCTFLFN